MSGGRQTPATPTHGRVVPMHRLREADSASVGPKIARLAALGAAGFPVPDGFAVTTGAWLEFIGTTGIGARIDAWLEQAQAAGADVTLAELEEVAARIRSEFDATALPPSMREDLVEAYDALCFDVREVDKPVAVRSSAVGEDAADHSFAGQYETWLGVSGVDEVDLHLRRAWASLYSARALDYRIRSGLEVRGTPMAVGVLELVRARAAGVAFSAHPLTGRSDRLVIEGSWGYGEAVVQGVVSPDHAELDREGLRVLDYRVGAKDTVSVMDYRRGAVLERPMPRAFRNARVLDEDELDAIARALIGVERHYGYPVDIEWVVPRGRRAGEPIVLVQARPITTMAGARAELHWDAVEYALRYGARME